ncbi:hypothetical protein Gorai_010644 [Gossypium raimondii]|uniref:Uncharacterized protein n=1 Tax=Gossypium raimondii TaxID=29730 RepID=A0A7J8PXK9_GOSRA|nr:hypothetical protein [Gossypium raimondii]
MGFQSKSSLQAENTVDDDDVMEDFNGEDSESGESLIDKLKYISCPENVDWIHKLPLDTDQEKKVDVNDDSTRQLVFYTKHWKGRGWHSRSSSQWGCRSFGHQTITRIFPHGESERQALSAEESDQRGRREGKTRKPRELLRKFKLRS